MRRLLNTLYVTQHDTYLSLDGDNIVILKDSTQLLRVPLLNFESIVTFGYTGASPALIRYCADRHISIVFLTTSGKFSARVVGKTYGNVLLRKRQYAITENIEITLSIVKNMMIGKLYNHKWILERMTREYPLRIDVESFKETSKHLGDLMQQIRLSETLEEIRGFEGQAAFRYFRHYNDMILNQKEDFYYHRRSRRPPLDRVNALLSFAYTLLANDIASALETVGLDPYVGYLHQDRPGRISLALDVMEELRGVMADRFILSIINKRLLQKNDFIRKENGAFLLTEDARKKFIQAWQAKKQEQITHPYLGEKISWGLVPYAQSMLLARFIRGDMDEYPTFLWK